MNLRVHVSKWIPALITLLLIGAIYLISENIPPEEIKSFIDSFGKLGVVVFILLMTSTNIIAPISNSPLLYVGYLSFGRDVIWMLAAANFISMVTNYWISRFWGRGIVEKLVGKGNMHKVDAVTKEYGLAALLFLRIFQAGLGDFVSYAAGLTSISFIPYLVVSLVGSLPALAIIYLLSSKVQNPIQLVLLNLLVAGVLSAVFVFYQIGKRYLKRG